MYREYIRIWVKVFKSGPSKISGRQPIRNLKWYDLLRQTNFLKAVFHKFYLIHSWILCLIYSCQLSGFPNVNFALLTRKQPHQTLMAQFDIVLDSEGYQELHSRVESTVGVWTSSLPALTALIRQTRCPNSVDCLFFTVIRAACLHTLWWFSFWPGNMQTYKQKIIQMIVNK